MLLANFPKNQKDNHISASVMIDMVGYAT